MLNFKKLNLHPNIINALEKKGYTTPTPIQEQAIPHLIEGKDLLGIAQTGTGKTAAFSLPILDKLANNQLVVKPNHIRALILTPTRELASQIADNIKLYGAGLKLKHAVIFGGVSEFHQIKALKAGVDIAIATPGRLLDLTNQGHVNFSQIEIFVLDEADRMLDLGFIVDIKKIITKLPAKKQSLLFSATMPKEVTSLVNSILRNPVTIQITPQATTVEKVNQKVYHVDKSHKSALLLDILNQDNVVSALVFCKTKRGANKISEYLEDYGVLVNEIHGNKSQNAREKALNDLRNKKIKVLIATDIVARGIDVSSISHVINYDIPHDPESYVHRIGRTARAGREGVAISFCDSSENLLLRAIEKTISMKIPVDNSHAFYKKAPTIDPNAGKILSRKNNSSKTNNHHNNRDSQKFKTKRISSNSNKNQHFLDNSDDKNYNRKPNFRDNNFEDSKNFDHKKPRFSKFKKNESRDDFVPNSNKYFDKKNNNSNTDSVVKKIFNKIGFGKSRNFKSDSDENFTGNKKNFFNKKKSNFNPGFKSRDRNFKGFASDRSPDSNEGFSQENKSINYAKKRPFAKNFSSKNSKFTTKKPFKSNNFRKNKY
jgi:ATP-dependent RNA helicase RhlE